MKRLLVLLLACTPPPKGPTAILRFVDPTVWSAKDRHDVLAGGIEWQRLGFKVQLEGTTTLPRCPNLWYKQTPQLTSCAIEIGVVRERGLMLNYQAMGQADRVTDTIRVDSSLINFDLMHVIAHEVGHILMNTGEHTLDGVMVSGGWKWWLSDADKALACKTIQRGCK